MTTRSRLLGTGIAGVLTANGMPHLVTAAVGCRMMTPLAVLQHDEALPQRV